VRRALVLALLANVALAAERAPDLLEAAAVTTPPALPGDAAWKAARPHVVRLAEQRAVHLHDRKANALLGAGAAPLELEVRVLASADTVALRLEWADPLFEPIDEKEVNTFADSVAVQVPERFGPGLRLPAISMGDDDAPVKLALLRATARGALESRLVAAGFGSSTRLAAAAPTEAMQWSADTRRWAAVVHVSSAAALVPVAFAVWDGARRERSGYKRLSPWAFVQRPAAAPDARYLDELRQGYGPIDPAAKERGRVLAEAVCVACHHLPGKALAPQGLAPSLEGIGAVATPSYLRDSIVQPSQVVLHEPNPNQHYAASAPRDANGAAPNAEAFRWGTVGADGRRTSKMPAFSNFTSEQLDDLVAYLRSLGATP
jgi:dimethylsulfide dehydrogenase subunit gamma